MKENSGSSTAIKELTCTLHGDALLAAHEGDGERVAVDLAATLRIARQMREMPFLLAEVISLERYREALFTWGVPLQRAPELLTDERLRLLEQAANDFADPAITLRLTATRMTFYDANYRVDADGPTLYFVGSNRKDDSGRPAMLTDEYHYDYRSQSVLRNVTFPWHWYCDDPHASRDGDHILWPVEPAEPNPSPAQEATK